MRLADGNPMTRVLAGLLLCDVVVFGLALPGMLLVDHRGVAVSLAACGIAMALALAGAGLLRRPLGWVLGWLAQLVGVALGLLTAMMFVLGGVFLLLWVISFVLGKRLEAEGRVATPASRADRGGRR